MKQVVKYGAALFVLIVIVQVAFILSIFNDVTEFAITLGMVLLMGWFGFWTKRRFKKYRDRKS